MSRPRKSEAAKLSRKISFRVDPEAYHRLESQAGRTDMSVNQLARKLACEGSKRLVIKVSQRVDPVLLKQLQKLSINVNQLAKNSHIFKRISPKLDSLCEKIERIIDQAIDERLGE